MTEGKDAYAGCLALAFTLQGSRSLFLPGRKWSWKQSFLPVQAGAAGLDP